MAATHHRHRKTKMMGRRRHADDEANGRPEVDLDDDSVTEGSVASDNGDDADGSDTSGVGASPTTPTPKKHGPAMSSMAKPITDTDIMLHGLSMAGTAAGQLEEVDFDDVTSTTAGAPTLPLGDGDITDPTAPVIVSSSSVMRQGPEPLGERRRREHDEYKKKRDEDPSFVPNRGFFFMHDQRQTGPAAGGYRSYGRSRGRGGGGRGGLAGPLGALPHRLHQDPTVSGQWTHDLHESVAEPPAPRYSAQPRHPVRLEVPPNGNGVIPTCPPSETPIDRTMSTEKQLGKLQIRVWLPAAGMISPLTFPGVVVTQYTKLPDHRPPLRRDKAVRISLPEAQPRFIFPADDRSFIFIPRAMRPNQQQRLRGKPQSRLGSIGGYSRRTSLFGGSYYGSVYSPSVAMSRRSSVVQDPRDVFSPTGSVIPRPGPLGSEHPRPAPVVRLPPTQQMPSVEKPAAPADSLAVQPQYPPTKPAFQEPRPVNLPMHQPRPQKAVSVTNIESPTSTATSLQNPPSNNSSNDAFQQAFHQQVPVSVSSSINGFPPDSMHARQSSYAASVRGHSTGTPLSQIPERAIHAAPFQPNVGYGAQAPGYTYQQPYVMQQPQGYYYPPPSPYTGTSTVGLGPSATAPAFVPNTHQTQGVHAPTQPYTSPPAQPDMQNPPSTTAGPNLVAQEHNGMVYYFDASQLGVVPQAPMNAYPPAPYSHHPGAPQGYAPVSMGPMPDGFFYPQHGPPPGMVYYPQ